MVMSRALFNKLPYSLTITVNTIINVPVWYTTDDFWYKLSLFTSELALVSKV